MGEWDERLGEGTETYQEEEGFDFVEIHREERKIASSCMLFFYL